MPHPDDRCEACVRIRQVLAVVDYRVGDIRDAAPFADAVPFDTAWLLLGSLGHLLEADDVVACLQAAAQRLAPGATLVLELPLPRKTFRVDEVGENSWAAPLPDGSDLRVTWGADDDAFDPLTQVRGASVAFDVVRDGAVVRSLADVVPTREFLLMVVNGETTCTM